MRPESSDSAARTELREMVVRLVHSSEQPRYQELMREHHYLGHLPKIGETLWYVAPHCSRQIATYQSVSPILGKWPRIGETLWYVASWREQWVALLSFSASALK